MNTFNGWQYLLIDVATQYGLDKKTFEERISWAEANLANLEELGKAKGHWKEQPLYVKATLAIRKAQQGIPTGHLVGMDGVCSGMQIMSVTTGCEAGAKATGLIDQDRRPDAYTDVTNAMNELLGGVGVSVSRDDAKNSTMTSLYGSKAQPREVFGEGTPALQAFYTSLETVAPGAWHLLQTLLDSWQSYALFHAWQLPDGFQVKAKVMDTIETRIEVEELGKASFTYQYEENIGVPKGHLNAKSNAANVVHSIDGYVVRSIHRRCNYDRTMVEQAKTLLGDEYTLRAYHKVQAELKDKHLTKYVQLWEETRMADVVILPYITPENVSQLPTELIHKLWTICTEMLDYKPFEVVTIHDEFKCHPNNMNHLRKQYVNILCDLADSEILSFILSQIHGRKRQYKKLSNNLSTKIRNANYALC